VVSDSGQQDSFDSGGKPLVLSGAPVLEYQPVVDLASGMLLGFEALLRWQHPTQGLILPGLLIPWAEANGDIVALGQWVLRQGCQDATGWPPSVQLAVNLSIVQLRRGVAPQTVEEALTSSGLPADRLTVEVTEHAMSDDYALRSLRSIAAMGVQLAVDDVGTSWNSFDRLRRMAVNTIKIDASFVNGLEAHEGINRMVVETVVHLAHSSGMSTIAEGVETELHAALVREFDSDAAQGYFFAPPLSVERTAKLAAATSYRFPLDGNGWMGTAPWDLPEEGKAPARSPEGPAADVAGGVTSPVVVTTDEPVDAVVDTVAVDTVAGDTVAGDTVAGDTVVVDTVVVDTVVVEAGAPKSAEGDASPVEAAPPDADGDTDASSNGSNGSNGSAGDDAPAPTRSTSSRTGSGRRPAAHAKPRPRRRRPKEGDDQ
jgi:EAL domain-containing protein (putative c-di-GMP-specific phosphodiesterase class I)